MADERVEKAVARLHEVDGAFRPPYSWIRVMTPLQELAEEVLNGQRAAVLARLREEGYLPFPVRKIGKAFMDFSSALDQQPPRLVAANRESLISLLVARHKTETYLRAYVTFAHVLVNDSPEDFHQLSHTILIEKNRTGRHQSVDLSSALCDVVMVYDLANLELHGFNQVSHR